ncbi:MAG: glycosyltransferase family 2 protein [Chloroflexi bacterium]|nr:MAG: glycosyltransferase family 2 protein [Chloroflexota bacterium]
MQQTPLISIIIVTWNSKAYLPTCLGKLSMQVFKNFEVIIVDNGSVDGSVDGVKEKYPVLDIRIKKLDRNTGFAVANNIGAGMARGKWLMLLNADAFPEADWLEKMVNDAEKYPNASFSSRQIQANNPEYLDGEGDRYRATGSAQRRKYNQPIYPAGEVEEVFSPCAAAALYPRQAFLDVGGFDEDYFSYYEDVDLGFRLRLYGLRAYYLPQSVVYHIGSASTGKYSEFSVYHAHRNLVWTYFKNMPSVLVWVYFPLHLLLNLYFSSACYSTGQCRIIWKAKKDALLGMGKILEKRKKIQANRRASLKEIYYALKLK